MRIICSGKFKRSKKFENTLTMNGGSNFKNNLNVRERSNSYPSAFREFG